MTQTEISQALKVVKASPRSQPVAILVAIRVNASVRREQQRRALVFCLHFDV